MTRQQPAPAATTRRFGIQFFTFFLAATFAAASAFAQQPATPAAPAPTSQPGDGDPAGAVHGRSAVNDEAEAWLRPRPAAEQEAEAG